MKGDNKFRELCDRSDLPWDFASGYEPRWYNGPSPNETQVLVFMAEPGAITKTEAEKLRPAIARNERRVITHRPWTDGYDLEAQEHYWRKFLLELSRHIWPVNTERNMFERLGVTCSFWMSLRAGVQTKTVPSEPLNYFVKLYLPRILALFSKARIVAAGSKAAERLVTIGCSFEKCSALTRPEANKPRAHESWRVVGEEIRKRLYEKQQ
jgi:hypothetical protein